MKLGDDTEEKFTQLEILNINRLMKFLRTRLASKGKKVSKDEYDNTTFVDCDIYSVDQLADFLCLSLMNFNQVPSFTHFTFEDTRFIEFFTEALIEGATLYALSSQALIERGREFKMEDSGVTFEPPNISEMLSTQYKDLLAQHFEKIKYIKSLITQWSEIELKNERK